MCIDWDDEAERESGEEREATWMGNGKQVGWGEAGGRSCPGKSPGKGARKEEEEEREREEREGERREETHERESEGQTSQAEERETGRETW